MGLQGLLKEFRGNYVIMRGHGRALRVLSGPETWRVLRGPEQELRGLGPSLGTWRLLVLPVGGGESGEGVMGGSLTQAHGAFLDHWSGKYSDEGFPSALTAVRLRLDAIPGAMATRNSMAAAGGQATPSFLTSKQKRGKRSEVERPYPGGLLLLVRTCGTSWTVLSY